MAQHLSLSNDADADGRLRPMIRFRGQDISFIAIDPRVTDLVPRVNSAMKRNKISSTLIFMPVVKGLLSTGVNAVIDGRAPALARIKAGKIELQLFCPLEEAAARRVNNDLIPRYEGDLKRLFTDLMVELAPADESLDQRDHRIQSQYEVYEGYDPTGFSVVREVIVEAHTELLRRRNAADGIKPLSREAIRAEIQGLRSKGKFAFDTSEVSTAEIVERLFRGLRRKRRVFRRKRKGCFPYGAEMHIKGLFLLFLRGE